MTRLGETIDRLHLTLAQVHEGGQDFRGAEAAALDGLRSLAEWSSARRVRRGRRDVQHGRAVAHHILTMTARDTGRVRELQHNARLAGELYSGEGAINRHAWVKMQLVTGLLRAGRSREAARVLARSMPAIKAASDPVLRSEILARRIEMIRLTSGRASAIDAYIELRMLDRSAEVEPLALQACRAYDLAALLLDVAEPSFTRGRVAWAQSLLSTSDDLLREHPLPLFIYHNNIAHALFALRDGDVADGELWLRRAEVLAIKNGFELFRCRSTRQQLERLN